MLKIRFEAETEYDLISPMTIANALTQASNLEIGDLDEISEHLSAYTKRYRERELHGVGVKCKNNI